VTVVIIAPTRGNNKSAELPVSPQSG